jgi:hypothetical protein
MANKFFNSELEDSLRFLLGKIETTKNIKIKIWCIS